MAEIVKFKRRPEAELRRSNTNRKSAEVIIFPGVRYERKLRPRKIADIKHRPVAERF